MPKFTVVKSLSGTSRNYIQAQAIMRGTVLHIQVIGEEINRSYGAVEDIEMASVASSFQEWLGKVGDPCYNTFADRVSKSSNKLYFRIQFARNGDGSVKFQIPAPEYNRSYGATFDVSAESSGKLVCVDTCLKQVDLSPYVS